MAVRFSWEDQWIHEVLANRLLRRYTVVLVLSADIAVPSGRPIDAIAFLQRAIEIERIYGNAEVDEVGPLYCTLAHAFLCVDRIDDAAAALESSLESPRRRLSGGEEAEVLSQIATLHERQGRIPSALRLLERAVERCEPKLGPDDAHSLRHRENLARLRALEPRSV
jgi:tetratricopeptide (TPR) repeat protein